MNRVGLRRIIQPVIHIHRSFLCFHHTGHFPCQFLEGAKVTSLDLHRNTASEEGTHIRRRIVRVNLTVHIFGQLRNLRCNLSRRDGGILLQKQIHGHTVTAASHGHQSAVSSGDRSDRLHAVNARNLLRHLIRALAEFLKRQFFVLLRRHCHGQLIGFHIHIHEGKSSGIRGKRTRHKQDDHTDEYHRLEPERQFQKLRISLLHFFKEGVPHLFGIFK